MIFRSLLVALVALGGAGSKRQYSRCERVTRRTLNETLHTWPVLISGTVLKVEEDKSDRRLLIATVSVKRVFAGEEYVSAKEEITLHGVGNADICRSSLRRGDTRILALSVTGDHLFLAAPPIRVSLHILDILHSLSTGRPFHKRRKAKHAICETSKCPYGARCSHPSGLCECRSTCKRTMFSAPVCGNDDVTYASLCHLSVRACVLEREQSQGRGSNSYSQRPLRISHHGECRKKNPCDDLRCGPGEECVLSEKDGVLSGICACPTRCDDYGDSVDSTPVCSNDGEDYRSLCHLRMAACQTSRNITLKFFGKCDPCSTMTCERGTVCKLEEGTRKPTCRCSRQCGFEDAPVCASDGKTYENACIMTVAGCRANRELVVFKNGKCDFMNPCESAKCTRFGQHCVIETSNATARCECTQECPQDMRPVCGADGVTYDNDCDLVRSACLSGRRNQIRHPGHCGSGACSSVLCPPAQVCIIDKDKAAPRCACPECTDELSEVCASDGRTYVNECRMRRAACLQGDERRKPLYVLYNGVCEGCARLTCDFYGECVSNERGKAACRCPECPLSNSSIVIGVGGENGRPVCGTDGVTYSSSCHLRAAACSAAKFIVPAFDGKCESCASIECAYGEECREGRCVCAQVCEERPPASAAVCGEDGVRYASRCHLSLAACHSRSIIDVRPLSHCKNTTTATTTTTTGIKATNTVFSRIKEVGCNCNSVGSYGPACDAHTGQCRCRPGVDGLRCDHCTPGLWGIHLIAKGKPSCSPCGCSVYGSSRLDCEQSTERCECKPGVCGEKCTECVDERHILTARGCVPKNAPRPRSCRQLQCLHGASCAEDRMPRCMCPPENKTATLACNDESVTYGGGEASTMHICGSDGVTYDNVCQLERFACTHQLDLRPVSLGPCPEDSGEVLIPPRTPTLKPTLSSAELTTTASRRLLGSPCDNPGDCAHISLATCVIRSEGKSGTCECEEKARQVGERRCEKRTEVLVENEHDNEIAEETRTTTSPSAGRIRTAEEGADSSPVQVPFAPTRPYPILSAVEFASPNARITWQALRMDVRNSAQIEMRIKPSAPDGLLLCWGRVVDGVAQGDFLALILMAWQPVFFWNLGSGTAYVKTHSPMPSHRWSTLRFGRDLRNGSIQLDEGEVFEAQSQGKLVHLDISGETLHIGGVPSPSVLPARLRQYFTSFQGSVSFLSINERFLSLESTPLWTPAVRLSTEEPCNSNAQVCGSHGVCQPRLDEATCKCSAGWSGEKCELASDDVKGAFFDGNGEFAYLNRVNETFDSLATSNFSFSIKTYSTDGHLWWEAGEEDFLLVFLRGGIVHIAVNLGNDGALKPVRIRSTRVDDGSWHRIRVEREQRYTKVFVDDEAPLTVVSSPGSSQLDTNGLAFLGGRAPKTPQTARFKLRSSFVGCIRDVNIVNRQLDVRFDTIGVVVPPPCKAA